MTIHTLEQKQRLPITREAAWDFFSHPRNLNDITPPDVGFEIVSQPGEEMYDGQIITYRIRLAPFVWVSWVTEIKSVDPGRAFADEQRFGPYKFWHHLHTFEEIPGGVLMRDLVHYSLSGGPIGAIAHAVYVGKKLKSIFEFRRQVLEAKFGSL